MKNLTLTISIVAIMSLMYACGSSKKTSETSENKTQPRDKVVTLSAYQDMGVSEFDALSEDGTSIVKKPFVWFTGIGKASEKQTAVELAQREAYATISRVITNAVLDQAERANIANDGVVKQALTQHWQQISSSVLKGCTPVGSSVIEYDTSTKMYNVTSKVGIPGSLYKKMMQEATSFKPDNLNKEQMDEFIDINKSIRESVDLQK